jgi:hypothetical protein
LKIGGKVIRFRPGAWILAPLFVIAWFAPQNAHADIQSGLSVSVYNNRPNGYNQYNNAPPLPSVSGNPLAGTTTFSRVEQNFDASPPFGLYEDFIVHYEGYVTSPISGNFRFWPQADDGTKLYIDDVLVQNDWRDKGGGGALSSYITFEAGVSKKFEMWFYENGGGAWTRLYWDIGSGWQIVPDSAFTTQVVPTTTTTTTIAPYLNTPRNLQVVSVSDSSVSLSWDTPEQSNADVERYAVMWSCENNWDAAWVLPSYTTEITITGLESATSCIFQVRADNDTIPVYSDWSQSVSGVTETTTTTTTSTTTTSTTTTTTEPETTTTIQETTTSEEITTTTEVVPATTLPETTTTVDSPPTGTTVEETTTTTEPEVTTTTIAGPEESAEDTIDTTTTQPEEPNGAESIQDTETTVPEPAPDTQNEAPQDANNEVVEVTADNLDEVLSGEITPEVVDAVVAALDSGDIEVTPEIVDAVVSAIKSGNLSDEQVVQAVTAILDAGIDEQIATQLATSSEVLSAVTGEQASEIFAEVSVSALTPEQAEAVVEAVQSAPTEVREAFEEQINVFGGKFDNYVPVGSKISVSERRTVVAVTVVSSVIAISATSTPPAPNGPTGSGGSGGGGPSGDAGSSGEEKEQPKGKRRRGGRR